MGIPPQAEVGALSALSAGPDHCLVEASIFDGMYANSSILFRYTDEQTWIKVGDLEGAFAELWTDSPPTKRLAMLRHWEIEGVYPIVLVSDDGGSSWAESAGFMDFFWSNSPGPFAHAQGLRRGRGGRIAVQVESEWFVSEKNGKWRRSSTSPSWYPKAPAKTPHGCKIVRRETVQWVEKLEENGYVQISTKVPVRQP